MTGTTNEWVNDIHCGDVTTVLDRMPADMAHSWITSPPYWQQRDYSADGQLGLEATPGEYIENIVGIVKKVSRVARPDALGWLVVDDTFRDGAMLGIPSRLETRLRGAGFRIIHRAPWTKPNPKPEAVEKRLSHSYETVFCIAQSDSYWFDKQAAESPWDVFDVPVGASEFDHDAVYPPELPKRMVRLSTPPRVCAACGDPYTRDYEVRDIRDLPDDRPQAERALEKAAAANLTDDHLEACRAVGLGDVGQAQRTQTGTGANTDRVEALAAEAKQVLGGYFREFAQAKKRPVGWSSECDCDAGHKSGIVLDPFAGTGTTCAVAKELGRRWAGVELNPEFVALAQKRVGVTVDEPEHLRRADEQPLTAFTEADP